MADISHKLNICASLAALREIRIPKGAATARQALHGTLANQTPIVTHRTLLVWQPLPSLRRLHNESRIDLPNRFYPSAAFGGRPHIWISQG
jgi:hypothetical protein